MPRLAPSRCLAALTLLLASATVLAQPDSATTGFDCRQLADAPSSDTTPRDWLERSLWASHCYQFQARAVRISGAGVRTLALSHEIRDGTEHEVASYLDGPPVVYRRQGRVGRDDLSGAIGSGRTSPSAIMARLDAHYRFSVDGESRIAGRNVVRLDVAPLDNLRYGHRLWLDRETGLPLKQVLIGLDGRVLETFQMTELGQPRLYERAVAFEPADDPPPGLWRPGWLPAGYRPLSLPDGHGVEAEPLSQRLYSDGLSSFSLFIEPLRGPDAALRPGLHRLGISHAAVRHVRLDDRVFQIVVVGEVPPLVLARVADRVDYRPAASKTASP
ncbi:MucB/RseB C-terminal domain-containing protein [Modicisalibacter coralii]|uniref:MucB/RseB C-terminal domain-containing protein n=1 Tax=Modicisalibacter coralii TaxID=2304602 RepID=UPI001F418386|nr:MucB/RseB C-terminal domain-containing protein [Halomonas coralii]